MSVQFSQIKDTQHYKQWAALLDQIRGLKYPVDSLTPEPSIPVVNSETSLQLFTVPSTQTVSVVPQDTREKPVERVRTRYDFKMVLKGFDGCIRASLGADSSSILVSSGECTVEGTESVSSSVGLVVRSHGQVIISLDSFEISNTFKNSQYGHSLEGGWYSFLMTKCRISSSSSLGFRFTQRTMTAISAAPC